MMATTRWWLEVVEVAYMNKQGRDDGREAAGKEGGREGTREGHGQ